MIDGSGTIVDKYKQTIVMLLSGATQQEDNFDLERCSCCS